MQIHSHRYNYLYLIFDIINREAKELLFYSIVIILKYYKKVKSIISSVVVRQKRRVVRRDVASPLSDTRF